VNPVFFSLATLGALLLIIFLARRFILQRQNRPAPFLDAQLRDPNWQEVERRYGMPVPIAVKRDLYDPTIALSKDISVSTATGQWEISRFNPTGLAVTDTGTRFNFAIDWCGNQYSIDIAEADSPVWLFDHELREETRVAHHLSEFVECLRQCVKTR
jgi:hypothetical protein